MTDDIMVSLTDITRNDNRIRSQGRARKDKEKKGGSEEKDRQEEKVLDRIVLKEVLETLEAKERTIIYLRYFAGKTQAEIGKKMGMSQVQVSRTEKKVLERMRKEMKR